MAKLNGTYTGQEHTEWRCFAIIMARVGKLIANAEDSEQFEAESVRKDDGADVQARIDAAVRAALAAKDMDKKQHDAQPLVSRSAIIGSTLASAIMRGAGSLMMVNLEADQLIRRRRTRTTSRQNM